MGGRGATSGVPIREISFKDGDFDKFRFGDLRPRRDSNAYYEVDRINSAKDKIIVTVPSERVFQTKYGYGLILNADHVLWLKSWQVGRGKLWNGSRYEVHTNVLLQKNYFNPSKANYERTDYPYERVSLTWQEWEGYARAQSKNGRAYWKIDGQRRLFESLAKQREKKKMRK